MAKTNPMYKDTVFRMLFQEPKEALSLYNALNGTSYDDPDRLEIVTLENAIYLNVKNDVAIMFDSTLSLFEHQSTVNPNIPLRDLYYAAAELHKMFPPKLLYGRKKKQIPVPRFVVFYNGKEWQAERITYRLSDLYEKQAENPELELIVTVYNINAGMNEALKNACRSLKEYMIFVDMVKEYQKTMPLEEAIGKAVNDCMAQGILKEFLEKNRDQVVDLGLGEFGQDLYDDIIREEGREEGRKEGREEERENTERERQRADAEKQRAETEKQRAEAAEAEVERLKELLRERR